LSVGVAAATFVSTGEDGDCGRGDVLFNSVVDIHTGVRRSGRILSTENADNIPAVKAEAAAHIIINVVRILMERGMVLPSSGGWVGRQYPNNNPTKLNNGTETPQHGNPKGEKMPKKKAHVAQNRIQ
jgi:hypothetical protein